MRKSFLRAYARSAGISTDEAEDEVLRIILQVAHNLAATYVFGYHSEDDMLQQGVLFALEVIDSGRYDATRPLENFLHVHVSNRLKNFKRDHFIRSEPPCSCCDTFGTPSNPCERWKRWKRINSAKQSLAAPVGSSFPLELTLTDETDILDDASDREIRGKLLAQLPPSLRADLLRMLDGAAVSKSRRIAVRSACLKVLGTSTERN